MKTASALLLAALTAILNACGGSTAVPAVNGLAGGTPVPPAVVQLSSLPALPDDGPYWSRQVSTTGTFTTDGVETFADCGAPGAAPTTTPPQPTWLTLDGTAAGKFAWAIWQIPLSDTTTLDSFGINVQQSGTNQFWVAWANYSKGYWEFESNTDPLGKAGARTITPASELDLHSPGHNAYVAILVLPGEKINVSGLDSTVTTEGGGGNDPIFDQFENNDSLETAYTLPGPGEYRASVHETPRPDMTDPAEMRDKFDFYKIHVDAGNTLTVTLRHEDWDHFAPGSVTMDLDLLFYLPGSTDELSGFEEQYSGLSPNFPFEQCVYPAGASGDYLIGVIATFGDGDIPDDAEYYLNVFITPSPGVHSIEGHIRQGASHAEPDKKLCAFLTPGNFNAVSHDDEGHPYGRFKFEGVPDGSYTMHVHGNGYFSGQEDYTWPETLPVTVAGSDLTDLDIDIGDDPS